MKIDGKHLVLGNGHLSKEIQDMLRKHGIDYEVTGRDILSYPEKVPYKEYFEQFGMIWNCIGHGTVGGDSQKQIMAHVGLIDFLLQMDIYQVHFSSNYVYQKNKSVYATTKLLGEIVGQTRDNKKSLFVRVANLCGDKYGIVYKLTKALSENKLIDVVPNHVSPTNTRALADCLVSSHEKLLEDRVKYSNPFIDIYAEKIPVFKLAQEIIKIIKELNPSFVEPELRLKFDLERPDLYPDADIVIEDCAFNQTEIAKALI